jgi:hypothetical protein
MPVPVHVPHAVLLLVLCAVHARVRWLVCTAS